MSGHPSAFCSKVERSEYWAVFGDVDRAEPPWITQFHKSAPRQFVLAPSADAEVNFDSFQIGVERCAEPVGLQFVAAGMNVFDHRIMIVASGGQRVRGPG
jgi:hypothetical protein